jgi:hypothetical protein
MKIKLETGCRIPFKLSCLYKFGHSKGAEINLEDGFILQVPIPSYVRYGNKGYIDWLKSDDGQNEIERQLKRYGYKSE